MARSDTPRTWTTSDGVTVRPGLRVMTNDWKWGTVGGKQFTTDGGSSSVGGEYFDGWFEVLYDGQTRGDRFNGDRMTTRQPLDGPADPNPAAGPGVVALERGAYWTVAYRKARANRYLRVDLFLTWDQAHDLAGQVAAALPAGHEVCYVPNAAWDAAHVGHEDAGNILAGTGRRIRIMDGGSLPDGVMVAAADAARDGAVREHHDRYPTTATARRYAHRFITARDGSRVCTDCGECFTPAELAAGRRLESDGSEIEPRCVGAGHAPARSWSAHTLAAPGALCDGNTRHQMSTFACRGNRVTDGPAAAVHEWEGRNHCGYHSPFTVTPEQRAALAARDTAPAAPTAPETADTVEDADPFADVAITAVWSSYGHRFMSTDAPEHEACLTCGAMFELSRDLDEDPAGSYGKYTAANGDDPAACSGDTGRVHGYAGERVCGECYQDTHTTCSHVVHTCNCLFCA